ncbi:MAG: ASCH domain-containing protein, partial [Anaerolineae bacterium]|nr:ASCH domain-containing protein [Anaerolineae bacterium]
MKALSFHQPRAEQIARGEKTVDIRSWQVAYRGPLAVHASTKRRDDRCRALGYDPESLAYGAVIGTVELFDIRPLDAPAYDALHERHRLSSPFPGDPCYAWFFASPRRLESPLPVRGRMRLFEMELCKGQEVGGREQESKGVGEQGGRGAGEQGAGGGEQESRGAGEQG